MSLSDRDSGEEYWFCACSAYSEHPEMVVCWRCEQPLVEVSAGGVDDETLMKNLLLLCVRYRRALEAITRPTLSSPSAYAKNVLDGDLMPEVLDV